MTQSKSYTLYQDLARALIRSGLDEAYIVAGETFQHAGPFEVGQVLADYETKNPGNASDSVCRYQGPLAKHVEMLVHGSVLHLDCDGVVVKVEVAFIGRKNIRFFYSKIDALALSLSLSARVDELERKMSRLG